MGQEGRREETPSRRTSRPYSSRPRSSRERSRPKSSVVLKPRDPSPAPEAPIERDDRREASPRPSERTPVVQLTPRKEGRSGSPTPPPQQIPSRKGQAKGLHKGKPAKGKSKGWSKSSKGKGKSSSNEASPSPVDKRVQFLEEPEPPSRARSPTPPAGRKSSQSGILKASQYGSKGEKQEREKSPPAREEATPTQREHRQAGKEKVSPTKEKDPRPSTKTPWWLQKRQERRKIKAMDSSYEAQLQEH